MRQGDYEQAIEAFTQGLRLDKANGKLYLLRGVSHLKKASYEAAISDFDEAIRIDPQSWMAYDGRASVFGLKNYPAMMVADLTEAIRLEPGRALLFFKRGMVLLDMGEKERGLADLTHAAELDRRFHAPIPGSAASYKLQLDAFPSLGLIPGIGSRPWRVVRAEILEVTPEIIMDSQDRMLRGKWKERWYVDVAGQTMTHEIVFTADGRGGTFIAAVK
jgi:tetratricopeptide (TPR) repeat protein